MALIAGLATLIIMAIVLSPLFIVTVGTANVVCKTINKLKGETDE